MGVCKSSLNHTPGVVAKPYLRVFGGSVLQGGFFSAEFGVVLKETLTGSPCCDGKQISPEKKLFF